MAENTGIEYYPFNVDFFDDDKITLIESEFGVKGSMIAIRLLCKIYRQGYYYLWGDDECLIFSRKAGADFVPGTVKEVVKGLVRRSFFDKGVYDQFNILTSRGIQQRYVDAVKRRQVVTIRRELLLIDVSKYPNVHVVDSKPDTCNPVRVPATPQRANTLPQSPPQNSDLLDDEIQTMRNSPLWMENVAMRFHLSTEQVTARLEEFALDCRSRGTEGHNGIKDAQCHFNDWLRIQLNNVNTSNNATDRNTHDKRRAAKAVAARTEDFKTTF